MLRIRKHPQKRTRNRPTRKRFAQRPISHVLEAIGCLSLAGAFLYGFYAYAQTADCFCVKTVRVEGGDPAMGGAIIGQSGITNADNLICLDTKTVRENVTALPFVETCAVQRIFPDKVTIRIAKRIPAATLLVHNRLFAVDPHGYIVHEITMGEPHPGPFITNIPDTGYVEIGQQVTEPALQAALAVWHAFRQTSMAAQVTVSEISAPHPNRIFMYCDELTFEIRWGRGDFEKQAWKLDVLWNAQNRRLACREYVDLRFGNDVACR